MSVVSEISARIQANTEKERLAKKDADSLAATLPKITLKDCPNQNSFTQEATRSGNVSLYIGDYRREFSPAEARRLALWILQNFVDA